MTNTVRSRVRHDELEIDASNSVFGDPWYGTKKTLVVFYEYSAMRVHEVYTRVTKEGDRLTIRRLDTAWSHRVHPMHHGMPRILGAVYGTDDVVGRIEELVRKGYRRIEASNDNFGDPWFGYVKTLVVLYDDHHGRRKAKAVKEHERMRIH